MAVHLGWAAGVAAPPGCSGGPAAGVDGLLVAGDSGCEVGCFGEEVPGVVGVVESVVPVSPVGPVEVAVVVGVVGDGDVDGEVDGGEVGGGW